MSLYICVVYVRFSYYCVSSYLVLSSVIYLISPMFLSISLIRFCSAETWSLYVDAFYLSLIISALFSEIAVCISEHILPYCCIVKVLRSIPLDNITC
jgi:hypothetical protein